MCAINVLCFLENISFLTLGTTFLEQAMSQTREDLIYSAVPCLI